MSLESTQFPYRYFCSVTLWCWFSSAIAEPVLRHGLLLSPVHITANWNASHATYSTRVSYSSSSTTHSISRDCDGDIAWLHCILKGRNLKPIIRKWLLPLIRSTQKGNGIQIRVDLLVNIKWACFIYVCIEYVPMCLYDLQYSMKYNYRQVSNIRRTKSQHLKDSRTVLWLSLPNPLKPDV